jgi:hypothetical protein
MMDGSDQKLAGEPETFGIRPRNRREKRTQGAICQGWPDRASARLATGDRFPRKNLPAMVE